MKKDNIIVYEKENVLMNMIAVPYFGVYSHNYTFLMPSNVLHSNNITNEIFENFPKSLKKHMIEIQNNYKLNVDYFLVTLDGSILCSKFFDNAENGFLRLNYVPHPYIFYDINNLEKDHSTFIFSCLYTDTEDPKISKNYINETNEYDGLRINPEKLICDENKKEIILHKSEDNFPALSPNNCAFLVNINNLYFTVFNITMVTYKNKIVKYMIAQYNFFMNNEIYLTSSLLNNFNNNPLANIEGTKNFLINLLTHLNITSHIFNTIFAHFINAINNYLIENKQKGKFALDQVKGMIMDIFNFVFLKINFHNEDSDFSIIGDEGSINVSNYFYGDLCYFVWNNLGRCNISGIGELLLFSEGVKGHNIKSEVNFSLNDTIPECYVSEILRKYMRNLISDFQKIIYSYLTFVKESLLSHQLNQINYNDILKEAEINSIKVKDDILAFYFKQLCKYNEPTKLLSLNDFQHFIKNGIIMSEKSSVNLVNPVLLKFHEIIEEAFNSNLDNIKEKINDLDVPYQNLLFYRVWERKGKKMGIHPNFGKLSFIRSNQIPSNYHCDQEEIVEILLEVSGMIELFDTK